MAERCVSKRCRAWGARGSWKSWVDEADHGSLGILAALAKQSGDHPLFMALSQRIGKAGPTGLGMRVLRSSASVYTLSGLEESETTDLVRSLFGDAPNATRFAGWLHERTAGSPLHAVEVCRQLTAREVIRYAGGVWTLPVHRPDAELPAALGDALLLRIGTLTNDARRLAECLSLQREKATLELCRKLLEPMSEQQVLGILDELARNDVLYAEHDGYHFSSVALREALLAGMDDVREDQNHARLGEAFASVAGSKDGALRLRAGFHLIKGGDETRGAELIAAVASDSVTIRTLMANLHRVGEPLEAALKVYRRQRRTIYEIMPLLAALAQGGYYEERVWGDRYGDEALYVLEDISGLRAARRLRKFCGGILALILGILFAVVRFHTADRRERNYSFGQILVHLMTTVTTLSGTASLSLDADRATQVASALEPFSALPARLTPVGIHQFCRSLQEIGRDNEARAYDTFDLLLRRFADLRYYPTLPLDARKLYLAGAHFARASFAIFRADGKGALESADALDASGLLMYSMIASQIRFLYWTNRGEFSKAEVHRQEVELAAVQVGSVWQVETWESPALILTYTLLSDIVAATRVAHGIELMSRTVPTLRRYSRLAKEGLLLARAETATYTQLVAKEYERHEPRSYIGWAATMAYLAKGYNMRGRFADAKAVTDRIMVHITDADREYVSLFLNVDLQAAIADAGLGRVDEALARVDALLSRFQGIDHPLVHGLLHETRARIACAAGKTADYAHSLSQVERWFRPTENPLLIAMYERLARLQAVSLAEALDPDHDVLTRMELPSGDHVTATLTQPPG